MAPPPLEPGAVVRLAVTATFVADGNVETFNETSFEQGLLSLYPVESVALLSVTQGSINIEVRMLLPLDPLDTNGTAAHEILKALQNANVSALSEALGVELLSINSPALVSQAVAPPPPAPFIVLSTLSDEVKKFMDTFLAGTFIVTRKAGKS